MNANSLQHFHLAKAFHLISYLFLLLFSTSSFALDTICNPPGCKVYNIANPTDGVNLVVNDWGAATPNKPAILLLAGFPHNQEFWINQINSPLRAKYRIITMDWRGMGLSGKTTSLYTPQLFADDIKQVLSQLNVNKVVIVGHSAGGEVLQSYVTTYPSAMIKGIVFVDSTLLKPEFVTTYITPDALNLIGAGAFAPLTPDQFVGVNQSFLTLSTLAPLDPGMNNFLLSKDLLVPQAVRAALLSSRGNLDISLSNVTAKTLIIWGQNDAVVSVSAANYIHSLIPNNSKVAILPNTGHLPMIEKPIAFNILLGTFLTSINY